MKNFNWPKSLLVTIFTFCILNSASANTITVSSIAELQSAIAKAKPGDKIVVKDGVYTTSSDINITCVGTKGHPVTITAQDFGKVEVTGAGGFNLVSPSAYVIIRDFKFTHAASRAKSSSGSTFCRWTNNIFETPGDGEDLLIAGNDNEIDHNTFQNKNAMGRFLAIRGTGSQIAERLWIHHNYFKSQKDQGGKNGAETLQFGLSGFSLSSSNSMVEYNLFEDCAGENELISVKASAITLRYNTIRNCPAQFTLRHGNKSQVYGNYFYNTPGLRIFGDDHVVYSNYFENCDPAITIGNGDGEVADGAKLTSHDRPDRILIALNILLNNKANIVMTPRKDGMGATNVKVVNNIIEGGNQAAKIQGPYVNASWSGNIIFQTTGAGDMPGGTYVLKDPALRKDKFGVFQFPSGNAAVTYAGENFTAVQVPVLKPADVGAH
jgi:poly(beta-D-mannuronate) lyase